MANLVELLCARICRVYQSSHDIARGLLHTIITQWFEIKMLKASNDILHSEVTRLQSELNVKKQEVSGLCALMRQITSRVSINLLKSIIYHDF